MNWDLIGHEWAVDLLKEHIRRERLRHAYLLTGPLGAGRRTLALRFAKAINCEQPPSPGEACGSCRACRGIERMQHPDLSVVQAEPPGGTLKVEQVRELQHSLSLAPYEARYRIALLLNFEQAHPSAANALLKTLEEPPPQVILLLTAESPESLLPTIVSRCETLRLRPSPLEAVAGGLAKRWELEPEQARLLAHISAGRAGYALRLSQEPELLERRRERLDELSRLLGASRAERFAYVDAQYKDKESLRETLIFWLSFWRDVLIRSTGANSPLANLDREAEVEALAARVGFEPARRAVASLQRTLSLLDVNINTRLAFEVLMLDLPRVERSQAAV